MAKVIVERERLGGKYSRKGRAARSLEDLPRKQSMKRAHSDTKSLNENLNPLKRFLNASVGKPWNKVYSEISQNLKVASAVQQHVRDHIPDFVEKNVFIGADGRIMSIGRYYGKPTELREGMLFVCPKTGLLKCYKRKNQALKQRKSEFELCLEKLSREGTSLTIANGRVFKVFFDAHLNSLSIRQRATKAHANRDFLAQYPSNKAWIETLFLKFKRALPQSEYFEEYLRLLANAEEREVQKKLEENESLVGRNVLVSLDKGQSFQEGIINRVESFSEKFKIYYVTCGSKNIKVPTIHGKVLMKLKQ